jgi:hypothetical protein
MFFMGLLWDGIYMKIQMRRWNADWPPVFSIFAGMFEGIVLWFIVGLIMPVKLPYYILMYSVIWIIMFIFQLSLFNVFFPYARFKGGEIV